MMCQGGRVSEGAIPRPDIRPPLRARKEIAGVARGLTSLPRLIPGWSKLRRGGGRPIMVLPGFMTSDRSTVVLRQLLARLDYRVHGWGLGRNHGRVDQLVPRAVERVSELERRYARPVALVGWSLGGVIARESARERPASVDAIVTLGTPVVGGPKYTAAAERYLQRGYDLDAIERQVAERNATPIEAPITCVYSKHDAIVSWQACLDPNPANRVEYVEVELMHAELGFSAEVIEIITERLGR